MAKFKLKAALDGEKGKDHKVAKQRKHEREALKRKAKKEASAAEAAAEAVANGGVPVPLDEVEVKLNGKKKTKAQKNGVNPAPKAAEPAPAVKDSEWETDGEDEEGSDDDDDDMPERPALDLSRLDDSESDISSDEEEVQAEEEADEADEDAEDDEEEEDDDDDDDDDIPLSDLDSIASDDKGDIIPYQRLTINNTAALTAALHRIQLPYSKLAFSEYQAVTTAEPVEIADVEDDLTRELAFYKQSLSSVKDARGKLKKEGVSFSRPADYFAEMVKSDEHMGRIKKKLIDTAAGKKAAAEARKQRDLKKFGKQVQVAKLQERSKEKRDTIEKINTLKRKRQGADITTTNEEDLFDVAATTDEPKSERRGRKSDGDGKAFNNKRQKKDQKFGFGGKKRHAKSNDAQSSADTRDFSARKMKGKPGGASKRPGKDKRAKKH
ncbi:Ebp2-domain-containing protein [Clathrospora elynae]|uniref:Ebp2-domain-containing protein n=1 Tax=Clathrospora elynae TaxID=706981 RepID=A0A6A5SW71_9PLEO|nr:Ebp2-domain-containing protein [Clathrospora elynae]